MSDNVNKPAHYNQGGIETIDSIRASTGDGFIWYCVGNADKYIGRCRYKGKLLEDLRKCRNYVDWAIEEAEKLEAAVEGGNCPETPDSSDRKPLAIPSGWRELEPDEVPLATDMHEWMGVWYYRNDDATNEYKWHSSRHVRKIEPDEPKPLADHVSDAAKMMLDDPPPDGWRYLENGEVLRRGDVDTLNCEGFLSPINQDATGLTVRDAWRFIRKIETANPSENPNSSTWIPKVGDKVRVTAGYLNPVGTVGFIKEILEGLSNAFTIRTEDGKCTMGYFNASDVELIEAAS